MKIEVYEVYNLYSFMLIFVENYEKRTDFASY